MPKRTEVAVTSALFALVMYTLVLSVLASVETGTKVSNAGKVKTIGVGVYWNVECTDPIRRIDWGMLEPGSSKHVTCYVRNKGNTASTLSMNTSKWDPTNASDYISLSWDYDGQYIDLDEVVQVTFTLSVSANIEGITSFSFEITLAGSG